MKKLICTILLITHGILISADAPLSKPESFYQLSNNQNFVVISDSVDNTTIGFKREIKGANIKLWEIPGWHRSVFISDDGLYCIIGYSGLNLIPLNYQKDEVMLMIYKNGILQNKITLKDIITDFRKLNKTASHFQWGSIKGLKDEKIQISTVEQEIQIDIVTGKIIK